MSKLSTIHDTLGIINAAGSVLTSDASKKVLGGITTGLGVAERTLRSGQSITQISNQTMIISRVFIDENALGEPVLANLMKADHEWYSAQIIAALGLSNMVSDTRSVQNVMALIQTGHNEHNSGVLGNAAKGLGSPKFQNWYKQRYQGQESFVTNLVGESARDAFGLEAFNSPEPAFSTGRAGASAGKSYSTPTGNHGSSANLSGSKAFLEAQKENEELKKKIESWNSTSQVATRSVEVSKNLGPLGELFEVTITNPNDASASTKVPVYIQMQPTVIPAEIAPRFIDLNVIPEFWQRLTQWRSGEISFFKDFIAAKDIIARNKSFIKNPEAAAAFDEFQKTVGKKNRYALGDITDHVTAPRSSNLANSVVIFTEETVQQARADSQVNLHNQRDRDRYFRDTYTMIICVLDTLHQRVTIYFNGIDGFINRPYSDFKPANNKFDPGEFMTALQAFGNNSMVVCVNISGHTDLKIKDANL